MATAAVKAATAVKAAATTVEATAAAETVAAMKAATMEVAAMEVAASEALTAEALIVETAAMKAAIKATATVEAAMETAIKEAITVPEAKAAASEAKPRAGAYKNAAFKPVRAVIPVGRACVRRIIVIAIGAGGRWTVVDRRSETDAKGDALGVRVRSREETYTENNAKQTEQSYVSRSKVSHLWTLLDPCCYIHETRADGKSCAIASKRRTGWGLPIVGPETAPVEARAARSRAVGRVAVRMRACVLSERGTPRSG
jgi:hypothetical protein